MVNEYTPDEFNVRMAWVTTGIGPEDNLNAEFDRFVAKVKADAWQEGWAGRASRPHLGMYECIPAPDHINPYRNGEGRHVDQ